MRFLGLLLLVAILASSLAMFGCNDSTTLTRPQPTHKSGDIGPNEG